jgi:prepilin-type N-terminal cleavage/methylation domain-containing protein
MGKMTTRRTATGAGFTLIELLVTLSVIAILLTLGVPSFITLVLNQAVRTSVSNLQTSLFFARSEAIKRAVDVNVVPTGGDWRNGWAVQLADGTVLRSEAPLSDRLASMTGSTITYQSNGHIPPPAIRTIKVYVNGDSRITARCLAIDLSGRPSLVVDTDGNYSNGCN